MSKKIVLMGLIAWYSLAAYAQNQPSNSKQDLDTLKLNEVLITGTRFEVPIEKSGKTIYKLSREDIEKNAGKGLGDLLNEVPGIQVDGNFGSPGTNLSLYSRGGRNKNTLILIDGVPLNDPSGITASYDLRLLALHQIESIEVLKGGLSTLYGTGASATVINITLRKNQSESLNGNIDLNYGSFQTFNSRASLQDRIGKFSYSLSGNYLSSEGFSSASPEGASTDFDKDGLEQINGLLNLSYDFKDNFKLGAMLAYDDFDTEYDDGAFLDADNRQKGNMLRFGLSPTFLYKKGEIQLKSVFARNEREFQSSFPSAYTGQNLQIDLNQKHSFSPSLTGFWGLNTQVFAYEQEELISFEDSRFSLLDPYLSLFWEHDSGFTLHLGTRLNMHSEYGTNWVYNINPSYLIELSPKVQIKLLASLSTTFITPSGFQLFSDFGNVDLGPEESINYEVGASLFLAKSLVLNTVYFQRRESEAIIFISRFDEGGNYIGGDYQNFDGSRKVQGFEGDITFVISPQFLLAANYTHVRSDDAASFYRIPNQKFGLRAEYSPWKHTSLNVKYNYTGERTIFDFGAGEINLGSYGLLDIYLQQKVLSKRFTLYGAINNLLDEDFEGIYGFSTRGINYNLGVNYRF